MMRPMRPAKVDSQESQESQEPVPAVAPAGTRWHTPARAAVHLGGIRGASGASRDEQRARPAVQDTAASKLEALSEPGPHSLACP